MGTGKNVSPPLPTSAIQSNLKIDECIALRYSSESEYIVNNEM